MTYFKINDVDYSMCVNKLKVGTEHIYKGRQNANGDLSVKYVNTKKKLEVGIIPLDANTLSNLQTAINNFKVRVTYLDPQTKTLETINCIIPNNSVEYYTIQADNTSLKAFALTFTQL